MVQNRVARPVGAVMMIVIALLLLAAVAATSHAEGLFIEPYAGLAIPGGSLGDILGTGLAMGGALGYKVSDQFALVGRGAFSLHWPETETGQFIDLGSTSAIGVGGRFYVTPPREGAATAFVGGEIGRLEADWEYTSYEWFNVASELGTGSDGVGAWYLGLEGGLGYYLSDTFFLSGVTRVELPSWDDESNEGLDAGDFGGNLVRLEARLTINL